MGVTGRFHGPTVLPTQKVSYRKLLETQKLLQYLLCTTENTENIIQDSHSQNAGSNHDLSNKNGNFCKSSEWPVCHSMWLQIVDTDGEL